VKQLLSDKAALTAANESLQQALMDKTSQAAQDGAALRQQQAKLLAALQAEHQQQLERMETEAAAAYKAHQKV
jgi:hypothetical protein